MGTVYTAHLWSVTSVALTTIPGPGPDATHRWVVTDVVAINPAFSTFNQLLGWQLQDDAGYVIAGQTTDDARGSTFYHWTGRQVLDNPRILELNGLDASWLVRVTGFTLTLP